MYEIIAVSWTHGLSYGFSLSYASTVTISSASISASTTVSTAAVAASSMYWYLCVLTRRGESRPRAQMCSLRFWFGSPRGNKSPRLLPRHVQSLVATRRYVVRGTGHEIRRLLDAAHHIGALVGDSVMWFPVATDEQLDKPWCVQPRVSGSSGQIVLDPSVGIVDALVHYLVRFCRVWHD